MPDAIAPFDFSPGCVCPFQRMFIACACTDVVAMVAEALLEKFTRNLHSPRTSPISNTPEVDVPASLR